MSETKSAFAERTKRSLENILYSKPLREIRKRKFRNGDRVRISETDLPFRKFQFTQEDFEIVAISSRIIQHTQ